MKAVAASTRLDADADALAFFDRWAGRLGTQREAALAELAHRDPSLHARVQVMLAAAADDSPTRGLGVDAWAGAAKPAPTLQPGDQVAGWQLDEEVGRGGMASVWRAHRADGALKREVALKLPLAPHLSLTLAERFARERDVLAALNHPHIAQLYDAGVTAEGRPFVVLEYVRGRPLLEYAEVHALSRSARVELFMQVLDALAHAHRHMVVHRDLKPSNLLVTDAGSVKLLDFGIAKLLEPPPDAPQLTQDAGPVLTPRYAAPEQVAGQAISAQTDVHGAAVVLYELLTGRLPRGNAQLPLVSMLAAVTSDDAAQPRLGNDLDTVLLKALAREPAQRYVSIDAFADDLRRWLAHKPILARRVPAWQRVALLCRRHPRLVVVSALTTVVLVATAALALHRHLQSIEQERRAATVQRFLVSMLADTEPDETRPGAEVTARGLVDAALVRARQEYRNEPMVLGTLLSEIGRVYGRLGSFDAAAQVLEEALQLQEPRLVAGDVDLNVTRAFLAGVLRFTSPERAKPIALQVLTNCVGSGTGCARARSMAHTELARLAGDAGEDPASLEHARAAVAEARTGFGATSDDTAVALGELAVMARNMGRLGEAERAIAEAVEVAGRQTLRASDRAVLLRTQAVLDHDLGRYGLARDRLKRLLGESAPALEQIVQWRMLALSLWALGDFGAAQAAAAQARDLAAAGGHRLESAWAGMWHARISAVLGATAQAMGELAAADRALRADGHGDESFDLLRLGRFRAEVLLRSGEVDHARGELVRVLAQHAKAPVAHPVEHAETLDLSGRVAWAAGDSTAARQAHAAAAGLWAAAVPEDHPLRLRHAVYVALSESGNDAAAMASVKVRQQLHRYASVKPDGSGWNLQISNWQRWARDAGERVQPAPKGIPVALLLG